MGNGKVKAVFLDRDGVINKTVMRNGQVCPPAHLGELETIDDETRWALWTMKKAGFMLIVATNQPDVARGTQRREIVESINSTLMRTLPIDEILVCYHDDDDNCFCRKPKPGLLLMAAEKYSIDLSNSFMIGDRWRDIEAGKSAGCTTILIDYHYGGQESSPNCRVSSLREAMVWIIQEKRRRE